MKVDAITLEQGQGKYVRICVEVDLKKELLLKFAIQSKTFCIQYESLYTIYFCHSKYGHLAEFCLEKQILNNVHEGKKN